MAPKRRYFTATTKPKFSWIGEEIPPPPHMRKAGVGFKHYKGFSFGDLTAEIGDFVIVKSEDSSEDILSCDVARIERLYEDCYMSGDPYRVDVTWLCRPKDLPKQLSKHAFKEQGAPALDHRLDLILEARNFDTNISAESVYFKCNVFPSQITVNPESFISRCPESKYPNYILRFKLTSNSKGKSKRNFNLEPYKDGGLSPLKLTALKSPLKEQKPDNRSTFSRDASPEVGKIDKVLVPANFGFLLAQESLKIDKKRRRLSSRESSRESTPLKRIRNSKSVPASPDLAEIVMKTPSRENIVTADPTTPKGPTGLNGGYWGTDSPKRTPKLTKQMEENISLSLKKEKKNEEKLKEEKLKEESKNKKSISKRDKSDGKEVKGKKNAEKFTEIVTATGSGRKVRISCGGENKKSFGPSVGLGNSEIFSLLDSGDEEEQEQKEPASSMRGKKEIKPSRRRSEVAKSKPKSPEVVKPRARRASIAVIEKRTEPKKKALTMSETKKTKRVVVVETSSEESESDTDFEDSPSYKKKFGKGRKESSSEESNASEDEETERRSKTKKKTVAAVTPGRKSTKPVGLLERRGFTPGVAQRKAPVNSSVNPLVEAQLRLHVSAVPDSLPCREEEFAEIFGYVESKLQEGTGGCIYISGVPGTGKTATVKQVMRYMESNRDEFPDFNFFELNGMRLTCPEQTYVEMWRLLTGEKLVHEQAMKKLDHRFSTPVPRRTHTIFLVDELDMLCKKKQTVLYNIFEWPSRPQAKVVIIAIANTMDLPERDMDMRVISRLGFNRLHFEPYNQQQLQCIVSSRLEGLEVFQSDEIQLVSRKVAGLSGDARRALDICRILAERCEREGRDRVTQVDVLKVHREMFTSPKMMYIRTCSQLEQFFLRSMVNEFYKTGVEETTLRNISIRFDETCASEGVKSPSLHGLVSVAVRLSSQRLVLAEEYRKGLDTKLRLNVAYEDINFALNSRNT